VKKLIQIGAFVVCCTFGAAHADQTTTVLTEQGIVRFVSPTVTADDLANMLYGANRDSPKTRSVFKSPDPLVTVAMLIQFQFDSDALTAKSKKSLDTLGEMLQLDEMFDKNLTVEGHTDSVGSEDYNMALSMRRADSVKNYLVAAHDIDPGRLTTAGAGEGKLIDVANPKSGMNRRVQFSGSLE